MSRKRTAVRTGKDKTTCFAYYPESVDCHVRGGVKQKRLQAESSRCREVLKTMYEMYQHNDERVMSVREPKSDLPPPLHHDSPCPLSSRHGWNPKKCIPANGVQLNSSRYFTIYTK